MPKTLSEATVNEIGFVLIAAGNTWEDLIAHCTAAPATDKLDVDAEWVKATAEAIIKSNVKLSTNAQTFVAHTFARASQYKSVRFSPKQWSWFNSIMVDAGVEAIDLPVEVTP
jgi:hypothetical protein